MTPEKQALLMLKGVISEATAQEQAGVSAAAAKIRALILSAGDNGKVALCLVAAELAAED